MRAPETLLGTRLVATPSALDVYIAGFPSTVTALRFAPDEAFITGEIRVEIDDPSAIVELDAGFCVFRFEAAEFDRNVAARIEWTVPTSRPCLAQGKVLGVPVKIWLTDDRVLLICATAYAHELADRLR